MNVYIDERHPTEHVREQGRRNEKNLEEKVRNNVNTNKTGILLCRFKSTNRNKLLLLNTVIKNICIIFVSKFIF